MLIEPIEYVTLAVAAGALLLGTYALSIGSTRMAKAFGGFMVWLGVFYVEEAFVEASRAEPVMIFLASAVNVGVGVAFLRFLTASISDWRPLHRGVLAIGIGLTITGISLQLVDGTFNPHSASWRAADYPFWGDLLLSLCYAVSTGGIILFNIVHPMIVRYAAPERESAVRSLCFYSAGLTCFLGGAPAFWPAVLAFPAPWNAIAISWSIIMVATAIVGWALATRGHHRRIASITLVAILAIFGLGSLLALASPQIAYNILRAAGILVLAASALKGQMIGLDRKLRFGISKSAVAAIFVAVFFVASEGAQAFFGDRFQNEYFGIAAAGALVFAIAPIMRMADRFAAAAVPVAFDAEAIFRDSLRMALKDGRVDPDEDISLASQAEQLGISPRRMMELRREAEHA